MTIVDAAIVVTLVMNETIAIIVPNDIPLELVYVLSIEVYI
jgi:hypothetical protein